MTSIPVFFVSVLFTFAPRLVAPHVGKGVKLSRLILCSFLGWEQRGRARGRRGILVRSLNMVNKKVDVVVV